MPVYKSSLYAAHRPVYPQELFKIIYQFHSQFSPSLDLAADVGCGTGQTTAELCKTFQRVIGTDPSASMLESATEGPEYKQAGAEDFSKHFQPLSVDLITASTAAHWFNMPKFYQECQKVLKPDGSVAIWGYGHLFARKYPQIQEIINHFSSVTMGSKYWDDRRQYLDRMYSDPEFINSPFKTFKRTLYDDKEEEAIMHVNWSLDNIKAFLHTWSPYKTFLEQNPVIEQDPVDEVCDQIRRITGLEDDEEFQVSFPLVLILANNKI